ncbi:MAG: phosphate ABC transporter ATP-binding protein PstB [Clostridia bacterium]|nr:phosphate ABC transporter ATP-binding protein PstB [Clostridia bacterium]
MVYSNSGSIIISVKELNAWYGEKKALSNINIDIKKNSITAFIGPSGCGKTTLLRCLNRMNDLVDGFRLTGDILLDGESILSKNRDVIELRRKVGMVFQQPNPFPKTIFENMALPVKENFGNVRREKLEEIIETNLKAASLYEEVEDRLDSSALRLSGGQQQRLCIARALTINPEVILFDEPCSALDPISTMKIEDMLMELKQKYTIVIVTHNLHQASRIADEVAMFYEGQIVEQASTDVFFSNPKTQLAQDYISSKFS